VVRSRGCFRSARDLYLDGFFSVNLRGGCNSLRPCSGPVFGMIPSLRSDDVPAEPWEGNGPCKDCGGRNFPWRAPHELWESVMECEPGAGGVVCAKCFVIRAYAKGITRYIWHLVPTPPSMDPEVPPRGRVTPTYRRFVGPPVELLRQWYASYLNCQGDWTRWPPEREEAMPSAPAWRTPRTECDPLPRAPCSPQECSGPRSKWHRCGTCCPLPWSSCSKRQPWWPPFPWPPRWPVIAILLSLWKGLGRLVWVVSPSLSPTDRAPNRRFRPWGKNRWIVGSAPSGRSKSMTPTCGVAFRQSLLAKLGYGFDG